MSDERVHTFEDSIAEVKAVSDYRNSPAGQLSEMRSERVSSYPSLESAKIRWTQLASRPPAFALVRPETFTDIMSKYQTGQRFRKTRIGDSIAMEWDDTFILPSGPGMPVSEEIAAGEIHFYALPTDWL